MARPAFPRAMASDSGLRNAAVIENSFFTSLMKMEQEVPQALMDLFIDTKPSDGISGTYAMPGTVPTWRRWPRGKARQYSGLKEYYYSIVNTDWETTIQYHKNDLADDQSGNLQKQIDQAARRYAFLDIDVLVQLMEATTDVTLLESIPNTYYGLPLFSSSHSFVSGGNEVSLTGTDTVAKIETDLYAAREKFRSMTDDNGKPYWESNEADFSNFLIVAPNNNTKNFDALVNAKTILGDATAGGSRENILANKGLRLHIEPRLTNSSNWYVFLLADPTIKPFVKQPRQEPEFYLRKMDNSDHAFDTKMEAAGADARKGYSYYEARAAVKVTS